MTYQCAVCCDTGAIVDPAAPIIDTDADCLVDCPCCGDGDVAALGRAFVAVHKSRETQWLELTRLKAVEQAARNLIQQTTDGDIGVNADPWMDALVVALDAAAQPAKEATPGD